MSEPGKPSERDADRASQRFAAMGLERDPFPESDLHMDFFSRGGRERHLDALADLRGLGRPLVLITGPTGVGRSTFFHALMHRLPDDVRSARVTAGVFLSARNLLQAVARAMGLAVDAEESREEIRERLYEQIAELDSARTLCATLVDDADELEADALEELIGLAELSAETPNVRVLLFGGQGLRRVLADAVGAERVEPLAHEVRLEPYTLNELRGYLQFRLARAGLSGQSPFTEQDYQDIYVASLGLPRAANAEARRILLTHGKRLWPARSMLIGGGVAALLVVGLLVILLSPTTSGPDPAPVRELPLPGAPTVDLTLTSSSSYSSRPSSTETSISTATPPSAAPTQSSSRRESGAASGVRDGGWLPLTAEGEPAAAPEPRRAEIPTAAVPEPAAPVVAQHAPSPADGDRAQQPPPVTATQESAQPSTPAGRGPAGRGPARNALLDRNPSRYVLQVLVLSARDRAEAWVAERSEPSAYAIYPRTRDGATQYVILQGDYPDRRAASAAAASVASATGQTPFVRDMASVHNELRD
ncbi:MAG: AAA family ATPase [Gammaproteobacteria bacterium]|nr:AAA family ATPase [Gammaproteobacteria bacterium]